MNPIGCKDVMGIIQADYGALWHCFQRGNTLEVVTPYLYPNKSFVSVFITTRGEKIIVADGGHLEDFIQATNADEALHDVVLDNFLDTYKTQKHQQAEKTFYYKNCGTLKLVPSIIFDLCNFIVSVSAAVTSASLLATPEEESKSSETFRRQADNYLRDMVAGSRIIVFNQNLEQAPEARFSAIISKSSRLWLVPYLTGCDLRYFTMSMSNAIVNIELARASSLNPHIAAIIPLIDTKARGYEPMKLRNRVEKLEEVSNCKAVSWVERDLIKIPLEI